MTVESIKFASAGPGNSGDRIVMVVRLRDDGTWAPATAIIQPDSLPPMALPLIANADSPDEVAFIRDHARAMGEAGARCRLVEFGINRVLETFP